MNTHVYNIYNRDILPDTPSRLSKVGSFTVRHSTGEGYLVLEGGVEKPIKGDTFRKFIDFLKKNKIYNSIPETALELKNKNNIMLSAQTPLPSTMPTISVHNILIEREYSDSEEWEGNPEETSVSLKRVSFKTLATDVEIIDKRLTSNINKVENNGVTNAEALLNKLIMTELELDPLFSAESNNRILTNKDDRATEKVKLVFNKMDNPMDVVDPIEYENKVLTGAAGENIKTRVTEKINSLKIFSTVNVKNTLKDETIIEKALLSKDMDSILPIEANESDGISLRVEDNKLLIKHAEIGNKSTNIAPVYGEVKVISGIETDDMGHVTKITTKDLSKEIAELYHTKDEAGSTYVKKINLGTETIDGAVEIAKSLMVQKDMTVYGNFTSRGAVTAANTKEFTIKDNIFEIGSGNNTVYRYTGIKINVSKDGGSGTDAADAYIVYDNVDKTFRVMYATADPLDPNILIPVADAPIKARNFIGNAKYANRFKNEVSLQFTGDAQGAVKFYGDEGTIDVPLSVNKASSSAFGIVRLLESLDEEPKTNDIYSSLFLYDKLNKLSDFSLSHDYTPNPNSTPEENAKTIASLMAVYKVYDELYRFRQVYAAQKLKEEETALKNRTVVRSSSSSIVFNVALDETVVPDIRGKGLDLARFDSLANVGEKFLEFWRATFKMKIIQNTQKPLFTLMEKTPNIERIYLPVISSKKAPFGLTNAFKFQIRRYTTADDPTPVVISGASTLYNTDKQYIAKDVIEGASAVKEAFYNHLDFSDYKAGSVISNYAIKRNSQLFKIKGQGLSAFYNVQSPFKTDGGVFKDKTAARYEKDSKGFAVTLSDIDTDSAYVVAIYFKKLEAAADDSMGITCFMREYTVDGKYKDKQMGTIEMETLNALSSNSWYCYYGYIRASSGDFLTGDLFGLYNMTGDKNRRSDFPAATIGLLSPSNLIHDDNNVVRREFHFTKGSKSVIDVVTPVLMKRNPNWTVSNFLPENDDALFLTPNNNADEELRFVEFKISEENNKALQKMYYEIVCVTDGDFNNISNLKIATATTFGTEYDSTKPDEKILLEHGKTSGGKELTVNTSFSNEYAVAMTIKRKTEVQDTVVQDTFLPPKVTEVAMNNEYFIPKNGHSCLVLNNGTGVGVTNNAIFVYEESGVYGNNVWRYFSPAFEVLPEIDSVVNLEKWYGGRNAGDIVIVQNDPNIFGGAASWYQHDGSSGWETPRLYKSTMFSNYVNAASSSELVGDTKLAEYQTGNLDGRMAIVVSEQAFYTWKQISETEGAWEYGGVYRGIFNIVDQVATIEEFNQKFRKVCKPNITHAKVNVSGVWKRYIYTGAAIGSKWALSGDYIEYTQKFIVTEAITDKELIKNYYKVPANGNYTVVSTVPIDEFGKYNYLPTDDYYKYVISDGNGAWVKQGKYSTYKPPIADYNYTGEIVYAGGAIEHNINYTYKYVKANITEG